MGLFKEIHCAECKRKTFPFLRTKLTDGNCLCNRCTKIIPSYMKESFALTYLLDDYRELVAHIKESNETWRSVFHETHSYHSIHIDTIHNLFYIGYDINEHTLFLRFRYISNYKFTFHAEEFKKGTFGDKVTGKVLFRILMDAPYFYHEEILAYNVKAKAKESFFGSEVQHENPKDLQEFLVFFDSAYESDKEGVRSTYENSGEDTSQASELQQAMTLFMIDDLTKFTLSELKEQRNRLIKTFHPDKSTSDDTKYAQKINAAYEVLKNHLEAYK